MTTPQWVIFATAFFTPKAEAGDWTEAKVSATVKESFALSVARRCVEPLEVVRHERRRLLDDAVIGPPGCPL